jgi:hypothetical protein
MVQVRFPKLFTITLNFHTHIFDFQLLILLQSNVLIFTSQLLESGLLNHKVSFYHMSESLSVEVFV